MEKTARGRAQERTIIIDDVEAWSVSALLEHVRVAEQKSGVSVGKVSASLSIDLEYFENEGDFEAFREVLDARRLAYEVGKAA